MVPALFGRGRIFSLSATALWTAVAFACLAPAARGAVEVPACKTGPGGSRPADVYVPMDSWVYPALDRLHGLGYLDSAFLGLRPWTRRSVQRMLDETSHEESVGSNPQAAPILTALQGEFGSKEDGQGELSYGC